MEGRGHTVRRGLLSPSGDVGSARLPKTRFVGFVEMAASLGIASGVLTHIASLGLIGVSLGAIQKKIFVWHSGFWGDKTYGWHYDLLLLVCNLVTLTSGGGRFVLV